MWRLKTGCMGYLSDRLSTLAALRDKKKIGPEKEMASAGQGNFWWNGG